MKREDLKARGMTDEHIDFVLDEFHKEQELLKGQVQTLTSERDAARDEVKKYEQGGERRLIEYLDKLGWTAQQILDLIKYLNN